MITPIPEILDDLRAGKMVILVDDEDRENEGDLVVAAEHATGENINFMATHGRGLICMPMTLERLEELDLPPMTTKNTSPFGTAFHLSFEAATGVTTGISAQDRAHSIRVASEPSTMKNDLVRPGHVFPLAAKKGGVLVRAGQTEGSVDLCRLAGMRESAVICEIMKEDGTMARMPQLEVFSREHGINICTVQDLIEFRRKEESTVHLAASTKLPTNYGEFEMRIFESETDNLQHIALVHGDLADCDAPIVRVHSECLTGDLFGSLRCDCGIQLDKAMKMIVDEGCGVLLYVRQEGRGIGLVNKIKAYNLQDQGMDTVEANVHLGFDPDPREYGTGAQILSALGIKKFRLITNNPVKRAGLVGYGLEVIDRVPIEIPANDINRNYMATKKEKMGHIFETT